MSHDCENTVGYLIECGNEKLVYVTDTGYIKKEVKDYLKDADYYIFESNHDIEMLMQTKRPVYVKQRIINDYGHLCNEDSAHILSEVISEEKNKGNRIGTYFTRRKYKRNGIVYFKTDFG